MSARRRAVLAAALLLQAGAAAAAVPTPTPPGLEARAYLLLDVDTGAVLAEHDADAPFEPASLTKIMTVYLAFRALHEGLIAVDDEVLISRRARAAIGSRMFVEAGSRVPVLDLLRGIIVQSGNDASIALAEHIAGSEAAFAEMMNLEASRLELANSRFIDASGLGGPEHYMSARDVALVSAAMIREYPDDYRMFREREYTWNEITQPNRNRLLWRDETVDGIKTGYTEAAQYCLAASAARPDLDGMRLVAVVLGTPSARTRVRETQALLRWGFRFFRTRPALAPGAPLAQAPVWFADGAQVPVGAAAELRLTLPLGAHEELRTTVHLDAEPEAPLAAGQVLGRIAVRRDGRILHQAPAVALAAVPRAGFFSRLGDHIQRWLR